MIAFLAFFFSQAYSQQQPETKYKFTTLIELTNTPVKNQAKSGTCWSYSANSFLESEMIREDKDPVELSQLYTARCVYMEKAINYVRMHGSLNWGDGGELHDCIDMYAKYGAIPQNIYTGLHYGTTKNNFGEMQAILKGILDAVIANHNGKLTTSWYKAFNDVLDEYLGPVPKTFQYEGKKYTPLTFANERVGIDPKKYIEIGSVTTDPYYEKNFYFSQDNWAFKSVINVQIGDLTDIIDYALSHGYTVGWATDMSEKYFDGKTLGVAYVPEKEYEDMNDTEKKTIFDGPKPERVITPEMRQIAFDNYETTDDHGMHIVGLASDQTGRKYYIVKNSWGDNYGQKGYVYVTKAYVQYKTTAILVHEDAVPKDLLKKMKI